MINAGLSRTRRVAFDLAPSIYEILETAALDEDMGVQDLARRILVDYANSHLQTPVRPE